MANDPTLIPGVVWNTLETHSDQRGYLIEIFTGSSRSYRQANHSRSHRGALRGLHFHRRQADLWYLASGRAQVALIDLRVRRDPPMKATFTWAAREATLYIPPGVAHGFLALDDLDLIYFLTETYDSTDEYGIAWNDPQIALPWSISDPILSDRDRDNPPLVWEKLPAFS